MERGERERGSGREKGRKRSRPIRTPNRRDTRLIRRSQLVEAVQTGIHIRYGLGYGCSPVHPHPLRRLPDTDTNARTPPLGLHAPASILDFPHRIKR